MDLTAREITVLLADDHLVVRRGLRALLESVPGFTVVGEAVDGQQAIAAAREHRPDVVVMDVQMPGIDGLEATRQITRTVPGVAVVVLTMYENDDVVFGAVRAGARGYLLKGAGQEEIERALRGAVAGEAVFGPGVAARVLGYFAASPSRDDPFPELTPREREVLDLVAAGLRNGAIAHELALSTKTVANHLSSIFTKLAVADRSAAIVRARESGLGRA